MKIYRKRLGIVLIILSASLSAFAQISPQEAIQQMGRGINLGNTLDDRVGEGVTWGNTAEESYFEAYAQAGFNSVRIPITWDSHTETVSPYTVDTLFLARVEEVAGWALERNMWVVINAHHEDWLFEDDSQENFDRLDSIWSQVAVWFQDQPDSLVFEIINEPRTGTGILTQEQVDDLNERILGIIRKTNPNRNIIIGGKEWANKADLMAMNIPEDDHLIGYFHSYDPWDFAGEGNGTWGTSSDINQLRTQFAEVAQWSADNGNIPVFVGEFSARTACDFNSRMRWFAAYVEVALDNGFAFASWDDNGWFEILDRSTLTWSAPKDILVNNSVDNPTDLSLTNYNADSVLVAWTNRISDHDSIYIERGPDPMALSYLCTLPADAISYADTNLSENRNYYYRVNAALGDTAVLMSYPQKIRTEIVDGIEMLTFNNYFAVFPNPAQDWLQVRNYTEDNKIERILIYTLSGTKIRDEVVRDGKEISIYTGKLKQDTYILEIITAEEIYRKLFIKM